MAAPMTIFHEKGSLQQTTVYVEFSRVPTETSTMCSLNEDGEGRIMDTLPTPAMYYLCLFENSRLQVS